jgi:hypothetical protein
LSGVIPRCSASLSSAGSFGCSFTFSVVVDSCAPSSAVRVFVSLEISAIVARALFLTCFDGMNSTPFGVQLATFAMSLNASFAYSFITLSAVICRRLARPFCSWRIRFLTLAFLNSLDACDSADFGMYPARIAAFLPLQSTIHSRQNRSCFSVSFGASAIHYLPTPPSMAERGAVGMCRRSFIVR